MSHVNMFGQKLFNSIFAGGNKFQVMELVPADNFALPVDSPPLVILNPAGAVDVLMPAATELIKGLFFIISNISANTITLKTSADAAFTTAISIAAGETTLVFCTGSATAALGWRGMATAAST